MKINCILIVDDSEADQFYAQSIISLYDKNTRILVAYDGQEALDILDKEDEQPDIILLDINMPGLGGLDFLSEYDKRTKRSAVVVMLTTSAQSRDREACMAYNFVKLYISKPLEIKHLQEMATVIE